MHSNEDPTQPNIKTNKFIKKEKHVSQFIVLPHCSSHRIVIESLILKLVIYSQLPQITYKLCEGNGCVFSVHNNIATMTSVVTEQNRHLIYACLTFIFYS